MTRKNTSLDTDDIIRRYAAGESPSKIAASVSVSVETIYRRLAGVPRQRLAPGSEPVWLDEAIALKATGMTQREIGERFGTTQPEVSKWLVARGVRTDLSEVMKRRMAGMTPAERLAITAGAHAAVTGMTRSPDDLVKRAIGKQRTEAHATDEERALRVAFELVGLSPVLQQAVDKYNLDFGIAPVAVELFGGGWHAHGRHAARMPQRVKDLADAGWNLLIVWTHVVHPLDFAVVADDVLAYFERSRSDPAFRRQYRVIWGDGQFIAEGSVDDDKLTLIPSGIRGAYSARS